MADIIDEEYLIAVRRRLHRFPELSLQEEKTADFIRTELSRFGIEHRNVDRTGTFGVIHGRKEGRKVLLRADIDALPIQERTTLSFCSENDGVMHACGHDFHAAALLGAAKALQEMRDSFDGTVLLAFQQAEEYGHGSKFFVSEGLTRGYDRAFGIHIAPSVPVGKIALTRGADAAACDYFKITVKGKSAHISKPHLGVDALAAAAEIAVRLPKIQCHALNPLENSLIGIGRISAGTTWNIIAQDAVLEGTIRTLSNETQALLTEKITETAKAVASIYGAEAEVEFESFTPALINSDTAFDEAYKVSAELAGEENVITDRQLIMGFGGDDFAEFIQHAEGVYVHVGVANDNPVSQLPLHSEQLEPDEGALSIMARLHIDYALSVLNG